MKILRGQAFQQRREEIYKKYEPLLNVYSKWNEAARQATLAAGLKNYAERNKLVVYQRGEGLKQGLELLEFHPSFNKALRYLREQVDEPSIQPFYREGVQLVLNDLIAEQVESIALENLLAEAHI